MTVLQHGIKIFNYNDMKIVNYQIANKLKNIGFEEGTYHYYNIGDIRYCCDDYPSDHNGDCLREYEISAPMISQVLKWLREEKEVDLVIEPIYFFDENKHREYSVRIFAPLLNKPVHCGYFSTWEETALSGIEYVIDNLI